MISKILIVLAFIGLSTMNASAVTAPPPGVVGYEYGASKDSSLWMWVRLDQPGDVLVATGQSISPTDTVRMTLWVGRSGHAKPLGQPIVGRGSVAFAMVPAGCISVFGILTRGAAMKAVGTPTATPVGATPVPTPEAYTQPRNFCGRLR